MTKPPADLLNPKEKGRFRRLRRQGLAQAKTGAPLKGTVVSDHALNDGSATILTLRDLGRNLTREHLSKHQWRCQDGRVLPITEMRDAHLSNTLGLLERTRDAALKVGTAMQSVDGDKAREAFRIAARKAQWLMILEAELLRRHPDYLGRRLTPTKPTGNELFAMPDFYTAGVLADAD